MRCRPAVPADAGPGPRVRSVAQLSQATRTRVRWPAVSTSRPGRLGPVSHGIAQMSRVFWARVQVPAGWTSSPGRLAPGSVGPRFQLALLRDSGPCPRSREFHPLSRGLTPSSDGPRIDPNSRAPWALVHGPAVSTICPGPHALGTNSTWRPPAVQGDSRPCPMSRGTDQHSGASRARV